MIKCCTRFLKMLSRSVAEYQGMKNIDALWSKMCISSRQYNLKITKYNNVRTGEGAL